MTSFSLDPAARTERIDTDGPRRGTSRVELIIRRAGVEVDRTRVESIDRKRLKILCRPDEYEGVDTSNWWSAERDLCRSCRRIGGALIGCRGSIASRRKTDGKKNGRTAKEE
jgi:hypothetical protein